MPELQRDLRWGDYLNNLGRRICNAVTKFFSGGHYQGFFTIKESDAVISAKELQTELEERAAPKPE